MLHANRNRKPLMLQQLYNLQNEIQFLKDLLKDIPEENCIEIFSIQQRILTLEKRMKAHA